MAKIFDHIFVIDDDNTSQFVCEKVIQFLDLSIHLNFFENGEVALKHLTNFKKDIGESKPDLILLDLDMPVMDGFQFIKAIKKHKLNTNQLHIAILATTSSYSSKVQSIKALGIKYYISKPLNIEKMKEFCDQLEQPDSQKFLFIN